MYPKSFKTIDFYDDVEIQLSIYNLTLFAFLELLEAWASVSDFVTETMKKSRESMKRELDRRQNTNTG